MTPLEYLTRLRIHQAAVLLLQDLYNYVQNKVYYIDENGSQQRLEISQIDYAKRLYEQYKNL